MTKRDWKVGDRVICNDPAYGEDVCGKEGLIVSVNEKANLWEVKCASGEKLAFFADEMLPVPASELDAIERDMTDLFARMRAAIERLK